jgi:uncharacterized protein
MSRRRVTRILCAADPGAGNGLEGLMDVAEARDVDAVVLVGDLSTEGAEGYRSLFKALARGRLPTYWVPGPGDAPVHDYLREAHNMEIAFPFLHGVHGTAAFGPGYVLFAGLGGEISDDPDEPREELDRLRYPRWEPEYRLKLLRELKDYQLVLLFHTPPEHKGQGRAGSEVVAELINTYTPRIAVCGGERGTELLGRSLVIAPGSLSDGDYAIADIRAQEAQLEQLAATAAS